MRLPKEGGEWADADGDEKAFAHPKPRRAGEHNIIANNTLALISVLRLCIRVPPSLALSRPAGKEGTTDEAWQQHLRVKHDERSAHSSLLLLLLAAWKEGAGPFATSEGPTTHRRLLIFDSTSLLTASSYLAACCAVRGGRCVDYPRDSQKYSFSLFRYVHYESIDPLHFPLFKKY